jgi:hypothetical protein
MREGLGCGTLIDLIRGWRRRLDGRFRWRHTLIDLVRGISGIGDKRMCARGRLCEYDLLGFDLVGGEGLMG